MCFGRPLFSRESNIIESYRALPPLPLDLYYMPYSHSLMFVTIWSAVVFAGYRWMVSGSDSRRGVNHRHYLQREIRSTSLRAGYSRCALLSVMGSAAAEPCCWRRQDGRALSHSCGCGLLAGEKKNPLTQALDRGG